MIKMDWSDKKVLVTGGAGFIGSHLSETLLKLGANVTVLDLISKVGTTKINDFKDSIKVIDFDITEKENFHNLETDYDYIFHMAGVTSAYEFEKNPELGFKTNVEGTRNMLEFATKNNIKKFIFPSTAFVYGKLPQYIPIDEKHPIDISNNFYSQSKKQGEELCEAYRTSHNLPVIIFRLFTTFGPRQSKDYFFPTIILQAIKTGVVEIWSESPKRDFVYVQDTVNALIKGAESDFVGGPINIGSGSEVSIGEIGRSIASRFSVEFRSLNKDVLGPSRLLCNNSLAQNILAWQPQVSFEEGLENTINWFLSNHHLY